MLWSSLPALSDCTCAAFVERETDARMASEMQIFSDKKCCSLYWTGTNITQEYLRAYHQNTFTFRGHPLSGHFAVHSLSENRMTI
jgi:hypothetical protein